MIRILGYILVVAIVGAGFAWFANNPGDIVLTFAGQRWSTSLLVVVSGVVIALLVLLFFLWLIRLLIRTPAVISGHYKEKREKQGYEALTQGLVAVLSGDTANARRLTGRVEKYLDERHAPLLGFVQAETYLMEKDTASAVAVYERMREHETTRLLGLFGLYREAIKSGALDAAGQYAEAAIQISPGIKWANRAVLDRLSSEGAWQQAIALDEKMQKALPRQQRGTKSAHHRQSILLTARAMELFENNPDEARTAALKAHKIDPDFVPAVNVAAEILLRLQEVRKGSNLIEAMWKKHPHPDLAKTYINAVQGETAVNRLKRAQTLAKQNPDHFESHMILARTALEAGQLTLAKQQVEDAVRQEPRESAFLLAADIEEATSGDQGRVRQWLQRAVRAERDPVWMADGVTLETWAPVSPISGRLGAVEWKAPAHQLGPVFDQSELLVGDEKENGHPQVDLVVETKSAKQPKKSSTKPMRPDVVAPIVDGVVDDAPLDPVVTTHINVDDPGIGEDKSS